MDCFLLDIIRVLGIWSINRCHSHSALDHIMVKKHTHLLFVNITHIDLNQQFKINWKVDWTGNH